MNKMLSVLRTVNENCKNVTVFFFKKIMADDGRPAAVSRLPPVKPNPNQEDHG